MHNLRDTRKGVRIAPLSIKVKYVYKEVVVILL